MVTCSRRHSKKTLLLSHTARYCGSSSSQPATLVKSIALVIILQENKKGEEYYYCSGSYENQQELGCAPFAASRSDRRNPWTEKIFIEILFYFSKFESICGRNNFSHINDPILVVVKELGEEVGELVHLQENYMEGDCKTDRKQKDYQTSGL